MNPTDFCPCQMPIETEPLRVVQWRKKERLLVFLNSIDMSLAKW